MTVAVKDKDQLRVLRERQARLTSLANHPYWQELKDEFKRQKERHLKILAGDIMSDQPVDQRKLDYYRGFWQGCAWLLRNPEMAEKSLEAALVAAKLTDNE